MTKTFTRLAASLLLGLVSIGASAAVYYLKPGGTITTNTDWGLNTNGTGSNPNFAVTNTYDLTANNAAITLSSTWNITSGSTVNFGDGTNPLVFTLASGGSIGSSAPKVVFNNQCTLILQELMNFGFGATKTVFNAGSTVVYDTGSDNPIIKYSDNYHNLVINSAHIVFNPPVLDGDLTLNASLDLNQSGITVNGNLILNADLTFDQGGLTVAGTISGSGLLIGDNFASLTLTGTGSIGSLNFSNGFETLNTLDLSLGDATSQVDLGGDLFIDGGTASLNAGILNLNTFQLNIMNTGGVDFAGATIAGDNSASMILDGSINGSMSMDATNNSLAYLVMNSSGNTLSLASTLNIIDSISVHSGTLDPAGNLVLVSTSQLKGRLGYVNTAAGAAVSSPMTVQTFIPSGTTGWGQLGVSGVQGQTVANWEDDIPMTCVSCPYDEYATGGYFVSINSYTEATDVYDTTIAYTTPLPPGQGWWVYLGDGAMTSNALTLVNSGTAVTGTVGVPITFAGISSNAGWNLVANPYASPIDWDLVAADNPLVQSDIYSWSAGSGDASYVGGVGTNGFNNGEIAMGQGFYVNSLAFSGTLAFREGHKIFNSNNPEIIKKPAASAFNPGKWFKMKIKGSNLDNNETAVRLHPDATDGFDKGLDAKKNFTSPGYAGYPGTYSQYTSISTKDPQGKDYSIQSVAPPTGTLSMPVLVRAMVTGQYTISATGYDDIENCLLLHDKLTGTYHDLKAGPFVVTLADTTQSPRFELLVCGEADPTNVAELKQSRNIFISADNQGVFVRTAFEQPTHATISVYNLLGQKVAGDIAVNGTVNTTRIPGAFNNQVLLVRVDTENESVTKKVISR